MDYKNIFENYGLIKNKINKLLNAIDRNYIKNELDNNKDIYIKKSSKMSIFVCITKRNEFIKK